MKFQALVNFKDPDAGDVEVGDPDHRNIYDNDVKKIPLARLKAYQQAGIVHIDGQPDQPLTDRPHVLNPDDVELKAHG